MRNVTLRAFGAVPLVFLALPLWPAVAAAAASDCLNDSDKKVCVQLTAEPDNTVQASRLDGARDTFVRYTAQISGLALPSSSRNVSVAFTLSPAVQIVDFSGSGTCSTSGATLSCLYDKLAENASETLRFTAKAPAYAGAATPTALVNTGVFGWNGRSATVSNSVSVSTNGGYTWVPANTAVTLVTHPQVADPSSQTSAQNPLFGKLQIPPRPIGFLAYFVLNAATDENLSLSCPGGVFFENNSDGGPYLCRDIGPPFDAGNPYRWVAAAIDTDVDGTFTDSPLLLTLIWDAGVVSAAQLAPTPATPTGTPPLAVFYRAGQSGDPVRAYAGTCAANAPPCLSDVQKYGTGDWTATLQLSILDNGGQEADPFVPPIAMRALQKLIDGLLEVADAGVVPPPVIIK